MRDLHQNPDYSYRRYLDIVVVITALSIQHHIAYSLLTR